MESTAASSSILHLPFILHPLCSDRSNGLDPRHLTFVILALVVAILAHPSGGFVRETVLDKKLFFADFRGRKSFSAGRFWRLAATSARQTVPVRVLWRPGQPARKANPVNGLSCGTGLACPMGRGA